ncbi:transposon-encoded TnpW family protein, partial [Agathobacter rectalis]|uniref:transposon-encoded TnpW family protein n=1 Tax=Agathobacter rectalis TaxID=39491 RepID=UPI00156EE6B4
MEKMMNKKTEGNTFTKKIGQTVYVVRYHFNEDAKETMQEKINRMLVTEASRAYGANVSVCEDCGAVQV